MLVLHLLGAPREVRLDGGLEAGEVLRVDTTEPVVDRPGPRLRRQAEHRPPATREVALVGAQVEGPQAVVGGLGRQRQPLLAAADGALLTDVVGNVVPQEGDAAAHGHQAHPEHALPRRHGNRETGERARLARPQHVLDGAHERGPDQRRHRPG